MLNVEAVESEESEGFKNNVAHVGGTCAPGREGDSYPGGSDAGVDGVSGGVAVVIGVAALSHVLGVKLRHVLGFSG